MQTKKEATPEKVRLLCLRPVRGGDRAYKKGKMPAGNIPGWVILLYNVFAVLYK